MKRILARNLKNTLKPSEQRRMEVINNDFREKYVMRKQKVSKLKLVMKIRNDSAWFCVEKLKKHSLETKRKLKFIRIQNESQQIRKKSPY